MQSPLSSKDRRNFIPQHRDQKDNIPEEEKGSDHKSYRNRQGSPDYAQSLESSDSFKSKSRLFLIKSSNQKPSKMKSKKTQFPPVGDDELQYSLVEIDQLKELLSQKDRQIYDLKTEMSIQTDKTKLMKTQIKENEQCAKLLQEELNSSKTTQVSLQTELEMSQAELSRRDIKIEQLTNELEILKSSQLSLIMEEKSTDSAVDSLSARIRELEMNLEVIPLLESQLRNKEAKIATLIDEKIAKDSYIESLLSQVRELERMNLSKSNPTPPIQTIKKFSIKNLAETPVQRQEGSSENQSFSELESIVNPKSLWLVSMENKLRRMRERTESQRSQYTRDNKSTVANTPSIHKRRPSRDMQIRSIFQQFSHRMKF